MSELFVSQVLAADVNIGYEEMVNTRVQNVNGKQVKNLLELVTLIGGCTEEFLRLDLEYNQVRQHGGFDCSLSCITVDRPCMQMTNIYSGNSIVQPRVLTGLVVSPLSSVPVSRQWLF